MISIQQSQTADTRTCDYANVTKETLLASSKQHISDVRLAENSDAKQASERREKKARLLELIAHKQDESLASKSIEKLTAMVEAL